MAGIKISNSFLDRLTLCQQFSDYFLSGFLTFRLWQKLLYIPQQLFPFSSTVTEISAGNMIAQNKMIFSRHPCARCDPTGFHPVKCEHRCCAVIHGIHLKKSLLGTFFLFILLPCYLECKCHHTGS